MTTNKKMIQVSLISVGFLLIILTYFLYPKMIENKVIQETVEDNVFSTDDDKSNTFERVEYNGFYQTDKPFVVKSEKATILKKEPNIVYMTNMNVEIQMADGRIVIITSDSGRYNKSTYDCFFEDNVKATDGETIILAENIDLLASDDSISVYNNVALTSKENSLLADKVEYDIETKYYQISMFNDKKVKIKLTE